MPDGKQERIDIVVSFLMSNGQKESGLYYDGELRTDNEGVTYMNGILDWDAFAYKFRGNPQASFETLAYHMFCRKFYITEGLPAFYNQKHIETEPHRCGDGTIVGFQAKYYSTPSITTAQKNELIKAIEGAAHTYSGLNLFLFLYQLSVFTELCQG